MEASIHRRIDRYIYISIIKNPGHGGGFARHESLWSASGASSARLKFEGQIRGWRNRYFQRNSRLVVCPSKIVSTDTSARAPRSLPVSNETTPFSFFRFSLENEVGERVAANTWR